MDSRNSLWRTQALSRTYLEGVRGAIPGAEMQVEVLLKIVSAWRPNPERVIDLGCGDGILGRAILERFPNAHVLFIDFSLPMLEVTREKVQESESVQVVQADFASPGWLASLNGGEDRDLIVSGFSIHHQPHDRKRELYAEIYSLLAPGGVFMNLEHVASATEAIAALFDDYFIDHLYAYQRRSDSDLSRQEVAKTYYTRPDKVENVLATVKLQCEWLREIGLRDVDCFFRVFELALFGGRKPDRYVA